MDQDAREAGSRVSGVAGSSAAGADNGVEADRSPDELRADIDQTREELGDTVAALAEKTDVKAQAQQRVAEVKQNVQRRREQLAARAKSTTPQSAQQGGQQVVARVRENPQAVAVGGAVLAGFLLGRLTSRSG